MNKNASSFPSVRLSDPSSEGLVINMSTYKRSFSLLAVGLCGVFLAQAASAEAKIGVVNFQKLLEEAPQTKTIMQALENEFTTNTGSVGRAISRNENATGRSYTSR